MADVETIRAGASCPRCRAENAMVRVDEPDIRGGPYWSCYSCGHVVEDTLPPIILQGPRMKHDIKGPTYSSGRHYSAKW